MQFERLKKNHRKQIIIGALAVCVIGGALTFSLTKAKYEVAQDLELAKGTINYKAYDFKIMAMYKSDNKTNYTEIEEMPSEGYTINEDKSYCNMSNGNQDTNAILKTIDGNHIISKLKKNDRCYLYFDKKITASETILANLGTSVKTEQPDFSQVATTDEGVFIADDPMYGTSAKTYYWRGAATTNYLKFANKCWRIIRINGDGSLRLIYDGATCHQNGVNTTDSIALLNTVYNISYYNSSYVGWTYDLENQRTLTGTSSNAKSKLESWYSSNIEEESNLKVADGKFCNDRNMASGYSWAAVPNNSFYYAGYDRLYDSYRPSLACNLNDIYTLKIALITADEVRMAGEGRPKSNYKYYLYNGQNYWTMTPFDWYANNYARVFFVYSGGGNLSSSHIHNENLGLRPVINLRSDITCSSGDGTLNNPYIVAD